MTTLEENKHVARRVPEGIATERNFDLIDELFAEDLVVHGSFGREVRGREAATAQFQATLAAFPDFEATVEEIVAEGDLVAMRTTLRGTHEGEFMGIEPTGKSFEIGNMVFTRITDGKITERWVQRDALSLLQQLGVVEQPTG